MAVLSHVSYRPSPVIASPNATLHHILQIIIVLFVGLFSIYSLVLASTDNSEYHPQQDPCTKDRITRSSPEKVARVLERPVL